MLTIIAGTFRGRRLAQPPAAITRPTSQRSREAIFNILAHHPTHKIQSAHILDAFSGSGAMGLEALSRGAAHVTFIEKHPAALKALKDNVVTLNVPEQTTIIARDLFQAMSAPRAMDLIFLDPPYEQDLATRALFHLQQQGWIGVETLIVLETPAKEELAPVHFTLLDQRSYGKAKISFLRTAA